MTILNYVLSITAMVLVGFLITANVYSQKKVKWYIRELIDEMTAITADLERRIAEAEMCIEEIGKSIEEIENSNKNEIEEEGKLKVWVEHDESGLN